MVAACGLRAQPIAGPRFISRFPSEAPKVKTPGQPQWHKSTDCDVTLHPADKPAAQAAWAQASFARRSPSREVRNPSRVLQCIVGRRHGRELKIALPSAIRT